MIQSHILLSQKPRGNRCSEAKRKDIASLKKVIHRPEKEGWKALAEEALKKRWHERSLRYHALEMADVEEEKKRNEEERLRLAALKEARETERANRHHAVDVTVL